MKRIDSFTLKLIGIFSLLAYAIRDTYRFWTPRALAEQLTYPRPFDAVLDPNNYLSANATAFMGRTADSISTYRPLFVVINGVDRSYTNWETSKLDMDKFADEFIVMAIPSRIQRAQRLVILYSVVDDAYRCIIGDAIVNKAISLSQCKRIINRAQTYIRKGEMDKGFSRMAEEFLIADDRRIFTGYFLIISFIACVFALMRKHSAVKSERKAKLARRLDSIRELHISEAETKDFLHMNCAVCLKAMSSSAPEMTTELDLTHPIKATTVGMSALYADAANYETSADMTNEAITHTPVVANDIPQLTTTIDLETQDFDRELRSCGHEFHHKCLNEMKRMNTNCPICEANLNISQKVEESTLKNILINVQKRLFKLWFAPEEIDSYYSNGNFLKISKLGRENPTLRPVITDVSFTKNPDQIMA